MSQLLSLIRSPLLFVGTTLVGLTTLGFAVRHFVRWIQCPPEPPPKSRDEFVAKEEVRPGLTWIGVLILGGSLTVLGIAGLAVTGPWPVSTFNTFFRASGLILDVAGVFLVAGSVERMVIDESGSALMWGQQEWEFPGVLLIVTGFLFLIATSFEALQVSGRPVSVTVTAEPLIEWLAGVGPLLVAVATGTAGWIAWQAHQRELARIKERTDAADARIAGLAYVVRRTLYKCLEMPWIQGDGRVKQDRAVQIRDMFSEHEPRVEQMLAEASQASHDVASDVRSAAKLFWIAADRIEDVAEATLEVRVKGEEGVSLGELPEEAEKRFRQTKPIVTEAVRVLKRLDAPIREGEG